VADLGSAQPQADLSPHSPDCPIKTDKLKQTRRVSYRVAWLWFLPEPVVVLGDDRLTVTDNPDQARVRVRAELPPARPGAVPRHEPGFVAPDEYVASLARKRMAVGALHRDQESRVLLAYPVYRDTWDLPGGAVDAEESPQAACRREVIEELGLDRPVGRILALDWVPSHPERPEGVIVIYDGGVLSGDEVEAIIVPGGELAGYEFVHPDQVARRVAPLVARRIAASLEALAAGTIASLEGGSPTG
jgi:8-oxo-dGTP diphosphatase